MTFLTRSLNIFIICMAILATASLLGCGSSNPPANPSGPDMGSAASTTTGASPATATAHAVPGYKVGSGDKLHIITYGQESLTNDFSVDGQGNIAFPLIGNVHVGGMTAEQIAATLENRLANGYINDPKVAVEVLTYRPFYVMGQVQKPGSYPYVDGLSVLQAVAIAGGFTLRADQNEVTVTRASDPQHKEQQVSVDAPVYPGDVVHVPVIFF